MDVPSARSTISDDLAKTPSMCSTLHVLRTQLKVSKIFFHFYFIYSQWYLSKCLELFNSASERFCSKHRNTGRMSLIDELSTTLRQLV